MSLKNELQTEEDIALKKSHYFKPQECFKFEAKIARVL